MDGEEPEEEGEEGEEEVIEMDESELIAMLEAEEPGLHVCRRLFLEEGGAAGGACRALAEAHLAHLWEHGYVVIDGAFGVAEAVALREDAMGLSGEGRLCLASELEHHAGDAEAGRFTDFGARSDRIAFVTAGDGPPGVAAGVARLREIQEDLAGAIRLARMGAEYQLAHFRPGGTRYERHRDALPDDGTEDEQRRVTAILYTSEGWDEGHGGALRLWIPRGAPGYEGGGEAGGAGGAGAGAGGGACACHGALGPGVARGVDAEGMATVEVAPVAGRVVLFLSGAVDHEVCPSFADRVALTAWMQ